MKRRLKYNGREQAFWGAVIPAAISLIGTGIGIASQNKAQRQAMEEQKRLRQQQLEREQMERTAGTLNNYFNTTDVEDREYEYAKGGRRKLRNAGVITDGGYAIPIDNNTYLLRGSLHSQVNESGKTGIGINTGKDEIEAEGGEVIQRKGNNLRIFSAHPMFANVSPAEAVMSGANKDDVFKAQEQVKRKYHLRNGKSSPVRDRAVWGATFTTPDYIGLGTNVLASILANTWGNRSYDRLLKDINFDLPDYVDESYVSGPTRVYDDAKRAAIRRQDINARNDILRNTASANVGLDRSQTVGTNSMYELMKVADDTLNKNIELRAADADRRQQARARNAAARNAWMQKVADIRNQQLTTRLGVAQSKLNSNVGMIQGIGSSIGGFLQQGIDNFENQQARIAQVSASEKGSAEIMARNGYKFTNNELANFYNTALSDYNRTGSNTDYDRVNLWYSKLSPKYIRRNNLQMPMYRPTSTNVTRNSLLNAMRRGSNILNNSRPNYLTPTGNLIPIR